MGNCLKLIEVVVLTIKKPTKLLTQLRREHKLLVMNPLTEGQSLFQLSSEKCV